jgi:polyribonucleotide nucleotidyltransferase
MDRLFLILCILTISNISKSQTKALTENGREVVLFENGTWKYSEDSSNDTTNPIDSLAINKNKFTKISGATFLVKSKIFNVGVFINPTKWIFSPHSDNEKNPEYRFSLKSNEGYVLMVTEKTQIDLESMRQIALENAQKASSDVKEKSAEYRIVNNKKILCLKFQGTIKGIKFTYFGYYYSNSNGTIQLLSYSSQQYFDSIQKELETFLNGLVEIEK